MTVRKTVSDIREAPAYTFAQASRYLKIPAPTVRAWVAGIHSPQQDFKPLIHRPERRDSRLSFNNLVEIHVLRALRTVHEVPMFAVRDALKFAEKKCGTPRLLIHEDLRAMPGTIFLDRLSELVDLTRSGQLVMRDYFEAHLQRVVYDPKGVPITLYPWLSGSVQETRKTILLNPQIGFGAPVTAQGRISTAVINSRYDAGETSEALAADYGLTRDEIEEAIKFEHAA